MCEIKVYNEATTSVRVFVNFGGISHFLSISIVDFEQTNPCQGIKKCRVVVPFCKTSAVFCSFKKFKYVPSRYLFGQNQQEKD